MHPSPGALNVVYGWLSDAREFCHLARLKALVCAVDALVRGGVLSVTGLGRSVGGNVLAKHSIKRMDRLVGNKHLALEVTEFARILAHRLLRKTPQPILLREGKDPARGREGASQPSRRSRLDTALGTVLCHHCCCTLHRSCPCGVLGGSHSSRGGA